MGFFLESVRSYDTMDSSRVAKGIVRRSFSPFRTSSGLTERNRRVAYVVYGECESEDRDRFSAKFEGSFIIETSLSKFD